MGFTMGDITTIPLQKCTRDRLKSIGSKGETYDKIIVRLLENADYIDFMERQYQILSRKDEFVPLDEIL